MTFLHVSEEKGFLWSFHLVISQRYEWGITYSVLVPLYSCYKYLLHHFPLRHFFIAVPIPCIPAGGWEQNVEQLLMTSICPGQGPEPPSHTQVAQASLTLLVLRHDIPQLALPTQLKCLLMWTDDKDKITHAQPGGALSS